VKYKLRFLLKAFDNNFYLLCNTIIVVKVMQVRCFEWLYMHQDFMYPTKNRLRYGLLYGDLFPSAAIASERQLCFCASLEIISLELAGEKDPRIQPETA
jgi:hypothetical protein